MKVELYFNESKELIGRFDIDVDYRNIFNNLYKVGELTYEAVGHTKSEPIRVYCEEIKPIECDVLEL